MFLNLIKSILGPWGIVVMNFYIEHQLIINLLVVSYAVFMIIIRQKRKKLSENINERSDTNESEGNNSTE